MYKTARINFPNQSNAVYDASGMRVANQVDGVWTFSVYDIGGKKVAEYGGLQSTDEGGVKYVLSDHQGSNRAIVNNAGYVNARMDYTAFGEEVASGIGQRTTNQGFGSSNTPDQKYALTERDKATGLDHTWFRKHESRAGRWTSPDPYNGSASIGNPQSFNRYSYVENQPTNFIDPSGLNAVVPGQGCGNWMKDHEGDWFWVPCIYAGTVTVNGRDPFTVTGSAAALSLWNPAGRSSSQESGNIQITGGEPRGQLPPKPEPPVTKPGIEVPTQKPVSKLDPSNPKLPPNPTLLQRAKFVVAIVLRVFEKVIKTVPIMVHPDTLCEVAAQEGDDFANSPLCSSRGGGYTVTGR